MSGYHLPPNLQNRRTDKDVDVLEYIFWFDLFSLWCSGKKRCIDLLTSWLRYIYNDIRIQQIKGGWLKRRMVPWVDGVG